MQRQLIQVAIGSGLILLIPLVAMQFTDEVNWNRLDFVAMGLILFGFGSMFVALARWLPQRRIWLGLIGLILFLLIWAELAVGIFTDWGS